MRRDQISKLHADLRAARLSGRGAHPDSVSLGTRKEYRGAARISLPDTAPDGGILDLLRRRASCKQCRLDGALTLEQAAALLSTLRVRQGATRPYPSGGSRYPVETYLVGGVADYARDIFHYDPVAHALEHVASAREDFEIATLFHPSPGYAGIAPTVLVFTSVWRRIACKYGDFGYILALLEAGHMAQNILLMATAIDLGARSMAGFADDVLNELLQIDGSDEQALYAVALSSVAPV